MGRAISQCVVIGLSTAVWACRKVAQATPISTALEMVISLRQNFKVTRALGSSNSRVHEFPGEGEQQKLVSDYNAPL